MAAQFGIALPASDAGQSPEFYASLLESREILAATVDTRYHLDEGTPPDGDLQAATLVDWLAASGSSPALARESAIRKLKDLALVTTDQQTNVVRLTVTTHWPGLSAQVAQRMIILVDSFNLASRQTRAGAERRFVEARLDQAQAELRSAEDRLQAFLQQNRDFHSSPKLTFDQDRLQREVTLRQGVVTSLTQAYETARISEVRDTPVVTVVEHPEVPVEPDRRHLALKLVLGVVLGALFGIAYAGARELLAATRAAGSADAAEFESLRDDAIADLQRVRSRVRRWLPFKQTAPESSRP